MPSAAGSAAVPDLSTLARPSGAFAMLAIDQREALRAMLSDHQPEPATDEQVTAFKLAAARILTQYASGVLVDKQFALDRVIDEGAIAPGCSLIAAADRFIAGPLDSVAGPPEIVADVEIDDAVDPLYYRQRGAVAMKLLVIYRPDGDPARRIGMVERFVARCRDAGLLSIIEPVSRRPADGTEWDWDEGILAAAKELGNRGADLYKAEMPYRGQGKHEDIRRGCAQLSELVASPWVVLSSGVPQDAFPGAVEIACDEGASGFLAGRAIWQGCIGRPDLEKSLREEGIPRLTLLAELVDKAVHQR